jgi:hypothetical protein
LGGTGGVLDLEAASYERFTARSEDQKGWLFESSAVDVIADGHELPTLVSNPRKASVLLIFL